MSNLVNHAKRELEILGDSSDNYQYEMNKCVIEIITMFAEQGHSGFSGRYAAQLINKLMKFEPLTPLTGDDSEWINVSETIEDFMLQNKRCSSVFKDNFGAWDINGIAYIDKDGSIFSCNDKKRMMISFPYTPKTEYLPYPESEDQKK